jgi:choline dehydrogenase
LIRDRSHSNRGFAEPRVTRRGILRLGSVLLSAASALAAGCTTLLRPRDDTPLQCEQGAVDDEFDFVVVGSGAGGGPLAAKLALSGFRVMLLEAGGDEQPLDSQVPAFHARASENRHMAWNFFVRHYGDDAQARRDPKFCPSEDGVLYPRCATVGGCTAHNAMILVCPHDSDWNDIALATGDPSWRSDNMRQYFERLERCEYPALVKPGSRHGFRGWLLTNVADPVLAVRDTFVRGILGATLSESIASAHASDRDLKDLIASGLDPNGWQFIRDREEGMCVMPLTTDRRTRVGSRDLIEKVQRACPTRLSVQTHALATRVLFDANRRATGVEYLSGRHLYAADPRRDDATEAVTRTVSARKEVILCAGTFNTPQLLKLSGIGPRAELERQGIAVIADRSGVGENLQDRYEISVVSRMRGDFSLMKGMTLRPPRPGEPGDPQFEAWRNGHGPYTTNGAVVSLIKRSRPTLREPDLYLFGLLGSFTGYFPGYSKRIAQEQDLFTWAILKAHTHNTQGRVRLRSSNPRDVPQIDFNYFAQGGKEDIDAVVDGVQAVRRINAACADIIAEEVVPGKDVASNQQLAEFIRDRAWGHHACGTCKMGPASDTAAVVDSRFRVHGTRGLRVVDASVFPRIPGFFLVSSVYMISEKAVDVIAEDARTTPA